MVNVTLWNGDAGVAERTFDSKEDAMQNLKTLREDGERKIVYDGWEIVYDGWGMIDENGLYSWELL